SSTRLPRTTTTRVSSGWVASISILLAIDESLFANPAPVRSRLRRRLRSAATGPRRRGGRGGGRHGGGAGRRHAPRKSLPGGVQSNPSSWICAYLNPKRDNGSCGRRFEPTVRHGHEPARFRSSVREASVAAGPRTRLTRALGGPWNRRPLAKGEVQVAPSVRDARIGKPRTRKPGAVPFKGGPPGREGR